MSKESGPGDNGPVPPAKDPFPIAVPRGDKHPAGGRVTRWIRDFIPSSSPDPAGAGSKSSGTAPVKSRRAADPVQRATTQMLPGRLQPMDPDVIQQEIRFLRAPSEEQVVTLGWNIGEPPGHVTLNHSSIQPLHAKMTYREGHWWIQNLAQHDPVVINYAVLPVSAAPRLLADGDRIRIGAVVFRFFFP